MYSIASKAKLRLAKQVYVEDRKMRLLTKKKLIEKKIHYYGFNSFN